MLKRTLYFTTPYHIGVRNNQLVATHKTTGEKKQAVLEDVGFILLDNEQITLTQAFAQHCNKHNVALVFCDAKHHPASMLLHFDTHHLQGKVVEKQAEAGEALRKNLWKQTIVAKIRNQAALLAYYQHENSRLQSLSKSVQSGDTSNCEAQAARYYWQHLPLIGDFRRARYGDNPNSMFNYAYAILRAATAKALVGSGLLPILGIHHRNQYNAYRLADDIMEPYRPFADALVLQTFEQFIDYQELTPPIKSELLRVLTLDVQMEKVMRPLSVALTFTTASLAKCYTGERRKIQYPRFVVKS